MKRALKFITTVFLLVSWMESFSQNLSNRGTEFWVSYPYNWFFENGGTQENSQEMVLYFSAETNATVTVTSHVGPSTWVRTYTVPAGTVAISEYIPKAGTYDSRLWDLPISFGGNGCEGFFDKGIHVTSTAPIVVYAHYTGSATSGAAMLFPVEAYGYTYTTLNNQQSYSNSYTYFYVMASHDNTTIQITPSVLTRGGKAPGVPFTITLNTHQSYQIIANSLSGDLTGSTIKSIANPAGQCYPIAVFCGTSRTGLGCSGPGSSGDFFMQQCFPSQAWGKRYLTAPTSNSTAANQLMTNIYRILVKDPTTVVKRNGVNLSGLINNSYYQFNSGTADYISSDKPIMVAQYMSSAGACPNTSGLGDPEMMYISPIEQAITRVGFFRNNKEAISINYLTLIIPTPGLPSLTIDGFNLFSYTYPHPNLPGYTVVVKRWTCTPANDPTNPPPPGQCIVQSDSAFTAITYGLGSVESYGYNAGTLINNLNAVTSIHNAYDSTSTENEFTCINSPVQLSVLMAYQPTRMEWLINQLGSVVTPNTNVIVNSPVSSGTVLINGVNYYKYTLPGTYQFSAADTFSIPILSTHPSIENCNNTEEVKINVIVKDEPISNFTFTHTGCTLDTVYFAGQSTSSNGYTLTHWNWEFPGPTTASGQNVKKLFAPGTHNVKLIVISAEGCLGDTTKQIVVQNKPTAGFTVSPIPVCEGSSLTFADTASNTGINPVTNWYWDYGNGVTTNSATANQLYTYPLYGTYTIKHVVSSSLSCVSDTVSKTIVVSAKPRTSFSFSNGCLPANGVVQFTNTSTVPDGQAINSYAWLFGDPNANAGNPNTSTLQNPTHNYSEGSYMIKLTATTANGCAKDTTIPATFSLKPALTYPALNNVCETAAPLSVATATVTNGVTGTGVYQGPGTSSSGIFNPSVAGYGTHTIWYVFTSTGNCKDSVSQTIRVYAAPRPNFSSTSGCLSPSGLVQFSNTTTVPDGQTITTWGWNFGDANANAGNPNTSALQNPTHNFAQGSYSINLAATTANGCQKDTTITITFNLNPTLAYPALTNVCENTAPVSVATATVTNSVPGTGVYNGPGTSSTGTFNPAVAGPGVHTIWYVFTSTANCKDSISRTITVYATPKPNFSYPSGCLPANGVIQFTNTSTISDAQTMNWLWNFGDPNANAGNPNTSLLQNPTHNFLAGTYNVNLQVTSSNGCVKDTTIISTFNLTPALQYPALSNVCENIAAYSIATATVTNNVTGTGVYQGPGTSSNGTFTPSVAGPGVHTIWYVFTSTANCKDSISRTITVYASPKPNFTYPSACLGTTQAVQFTNTTTIADAQTLSYTWNFADPNANAGNPNTSALQNPSHFYLPGSYNVNLSVTSSNGCTKDTTISATVNVKPALVYPPLASVCENISSVSVATANVTNGATGNGVYSGPGVNANGTFTPSVAGTGTHTVKYVFTTTAGCIDSVFQTIKVHPRPVTSFNVTPDVCQNQAASFTDLSTIASGNIKTWSWDFGDASNATYNNGNPFTKTYSNFNTYTVTLIATSDSGCVSLPATKPIKVHAVPVSSFNLPQTVCMPGGNGTFTNTSTTGDNAPLNYVWDFGDGTPTSNLPNPTHIYAASGNYMVSLAVTTSFGCTNSSSKPFNSFYDKPIASFSVTPDTLCQGSDNSFIDLSSAPNSTLSSWKWNFDDGSSSTAQNPTKRFTNPGSYDVELVVTNAVGCVSDPFINNVTVYIQPKIDAGPSFIVPQGTVIQFRPTVNDSVTVAFTWSPPFGLSSATALRPTLTAVQDQTYTLTATGVGNCTATDFITVKIMKPVRIPNAFSPNGDGINDTWVIDNLADYPGATVDVFNRYGALVYRSNGSTVPWDGTSNGKPLPLATYYYVIELKNGFKPLAGSITIVR